MPVLSTLSTACRDRYINYIQCMYSKGIVRKLSNSLKYGLDGAKRECLVRKARIISAYLDLLYCYKAFEDTVTYAYQFVFDRADSNTITITITIGAQTFVYSGTGDESAIVRFFDNLIENTTETPIEYHAEGVGGTLYVWTYAAAAAFNDTTSVTITVNTNPANTVTATSLESTYNAVILDQLNCITTEMFSDVTGHAIKLTEEDCSTNKV